MLSLFLFCVYSKFYRHMRPAQIAVFDSSTRIVTLLMTCDICSLNIFFDSKKATEMVSI